MQNFLAQFVYYKNNFIYFQYFYRRKKDPEYGVSRGIDFQNVSNIINFDFPKSVDAYIHRVGRYVLTAIIYILVL